MIHHCLCQERPVGLYGLWVVHGDWTGSGCQKGTYPAVPFPRNPLKRAVLRAACKGCPHALPYSFLNLPALLQPHWVPPRPRAKAICREGWEMVSLRKGGVF